jgi:tetratricopeptide (TPR) repeat protein
LPLLEQAVKQEAFMKVMVGRALMVASLSEGYLLAGRCDEAIRFAMQALDLSRKHGEQGHLAWVLRLLGAIYADLDPPAVGKAEDHYCQSLALAEDLGMRPLVAHGHLGLGTLYGKIGRREEARSELSAAIDLYRAMEMTFWLSRAEPELAKAG